MSDTIADICIRIREFADERDFDSDGNVSTTILRQFADMVEEAAPKAGNAAAMREALLRVKEARGRDLEYVTLADIDSEVDAALAAPPRNCDVGTADEQEKRFDSFCDAHYKPNNVDAECWGCPLMSHRNKCEFAWAQMPYEEGGAE